MHKICHKQKDQPGNKNYSSNQFWSARIPGRKFASERIHKIVKKL
jgi:hypothetical protein